MPRRITTAMALLLCLAVLLGSCNRGDDAPVDSSGDLLPADDLGRYLPKRLGEQRLVILTPTRTGEIFDDSASGFGLEDWVTEIRIADIGRHSERLGLVAVAAHEGGEPDKEMSVAFFGTTPGSFADEQTVEHAGQTYRTATVSNGFGDFEVAVWSPIETLTVAVTVSTHAVARGFTAADLMEEVIDHGTEGL